MTGAGLTTAEAAAVLGVSPRRVRQLADRGQLDAVAGQRGIRLARESVAERAARAPGRGRPWSPGTVWAAAWLLDGREPHWLNDRTLRRLRVRVATGDPEDVLARLALLTIVSRWAADSSDLSTIQAEAGTAWHRDPAGTLTVCLPRTRAVGLPIRYGLGAGTDLVLIAATGYRASADPYVPTLLL